MVSSAFSYYGFETVLFGFGSLTNQDGNNKLLTKKKLNLSGQ